MDVITYGVGSFFSSYAASLHKYAKTDLDFRQFALEQLSQFRPSIDHKYSSESTASIDMNPDLFTPPDRLAAIQRLKFLLNSTGEVKLQALTQLIPILDMTNGVSDEKLAGSWHGDPNRRKVLTQTIYTFAHPTPADLCNLSLGQFCGELECVDYHMPSLLPETLEWFQTDKSVSVLVVNTKEELSDRSAILNQHGAPFLLNEYPCGSIALAVSPSVDSTSLTSN